MMHRFNCRFAGKSCDDCRNIVDLFKQLHIPLDEQIVLWNMASRKSNYDGLKHTLELLLMPRQRQCPETGSW